MSNMSSEETSQMNEKKYKLCMYIYFMYIHLVSIFMQIAFSLLPSFHFLHNKLV